MPAVTDSSNQLTYFANCFTIGLLVITYPSRHNWARLGDDLPVSRRTDESSGFRVISGLHDARGLGRADGAITGL